MALGTCDPATRGDLWNTWTYSIEAVCWAIVRWDWDGVSVRPDCDGPVIDIHVVNISNDMFYCNLPNKKRGDRNIEIPPGTDIVISGGQLNNLGLQTYQDTSGPTISRTPYV